MDQSFQHAAPIKSALFVDFDNIYIGLSKTDPQAAERFASDPARWLSWLEKGLPAQDGRNTLVEPRSRSILIRRCYPNPDAGFRRFRSFFTSAAFTVIDCPSQTRMGKNSADIYMVMDILDTLNHRTNFDEFIIFSGDSDFMPVLLRLRAFDRRTTTLGIDFMPPAYKAACDLVINEEEFIEDALGIMNDGNCSGGNARIQVSENILNQMAARVYEATCADGEVAGADLPDILKDFREFRDSNNWLGFGTSQRLAEALICSEPRLHLVRLNPLMYKIILQPQVIPSVNLPANPVPTLEKGKNGLTAEREKSDKSELQRLRSQIVTAVKELAANSSSAILLARASQYVVSKLGPQVLETQWAGVGSFKRLLQSVENLGLEITSQPEPGYLFDPKRHIHPATARDRDGITDAEENQLEKAHSEDQQPEGESYLAADQYENEAEEEEEEPEETYEESLPSLEEFTRRVSQVTGAPDLSSRQYALLFHGIVNELQGIAEGQKVYNTYQSSKSVSDWCAEHGEQISRSDVVLIFKGIIFQDGVRFGKRPGSYTANELAGVVCNNIKALCRRSRLELTEMEGRLLVQWIQGGLNEEDVDEIIHQAESAAGLNASGFQPEN